MYTRSSFLGLVLFLVPAAAPAQERAEAWRLFEERMGPGLALVHLPGDGIEARGELRLADSIETPAARQQATRRVLAAARELLGVPPEELAPALERELAGLHLVQLEQRLDGVPVRGARVDLRLLADGRLLLLRARGLACGAPASDFVVSAAEARELARIALPAAPEALWAAAARPYFALGEDGRARAVYEVDVLDPEHPESSWIATIDASDGRLIERRSGLTDALDGSVHGHGVDLGPQPSDTPSLLPIANALVRGVDPGALAQRITDDVCENSDVAMSADGARIVWVADCDGQRELWTALADGSGLLKLTDHPGEDHSPAISADGARIVFVSDRDGDEELFAIQADGSGLTQLTANAARDHSPALSGDGVRVVYLSDQAGDDQLFTLLIAAPSPTQLTFAEAGSASPSLSLDGTRIAWISHASGSAELHCMRVDGSERVQLTSNGVDEQDPAISPDGTRVAFAARLAPAGPAPGDPSGAPGSLRAQRAQPFPSQLDIFLVASDGSFLERLTYGGADEHSPAWSADGEGLAWVNGSGAAAEIELFDLATGELISVTMNGTPDIGPRPGATLATGAWIANDGDGEVWIWDLSSPSVSDVTRTDADGDYTLDLPAGSTASVTVRLRGAWARVHELDPRWREVRATGSFPVPGSGADLELGAPDEEGPLAQVSAYYFTDLTHEIVAAAMLRPPLALDDPLPIDAQLRVRTNFPRPVPNAFYSLIERHTTFFIGAGPSRPNTAYDSVVAHETMHFYDDRIGGLSTGSPCEAPGAQAEGTADSGALLVTWLPHIGQDFWGPGKHLRDYSSFPWDSPVDPLLGFPTGAKGRQYDCRDCPMMGGLPRIHYHGQAFAGFSNALVGRIGVTTAEDLMAGVLLANPPDMQSAVYEAFLLSATPAFGGTGLPQTSPLYADLCWAAAAHGFDCPDRPDFGSLPCIFGFCGPAPALHRIIGTEWLGALVTADSGCEPAFSPDTDGVTMPAMAWKGGDPILLTFALSVDPMLKGRGRYGAPLPHPQLPERRVYLNAWLFVDDTMGGFTVHKLLGTGSGSGVLGPDSFEPGLDAVAFNPDTWTGATTTFDAPLMPPSFPEPRDAILRVRLDHGEDAGRLAGCLSHPALAQQCGPARFGEVEDYQLMIMP